MGRTASVTLGYGQSSASAGFVPSEEARIESIDGDDLGGGGRPCIFQMKKDAVSATESIGTSIADMRERSILNMEYSDIGDLCWDHSRSEVKIGRRSNGGEDGSQHAVFRVENSLQLEEEFRLRIQGAAARGRLEAQPTVSYVGMFAGPSKPKPFQRKRASVGEDSSSRLPQLRAMRKVAVDSHRGSGAPQNIKGGRRRELALEHIHTGNNTFTCTSVNGPEVERMWTRESIVVLNDESISLAREIRSTQRRGSSSSNGSGGGGAARQYDVLFSLPLVELDTWGVRDSGHMGGVSVTRSDGRIYFFGVAEVVHFQRTLEYFHNRFRLANGARCLPCSTHGREVVKIQTLEGDVDAAPVASGSLEICTADGAVVSGPGRRSSGAARPEFRRTGSSLGSPRRSSFLGGGGRPAVERHEVQGHWGKVVLHQGWLLKKGGATIKKWIQRYFVLYDTSQGHFLCYYASHTDAPLYSSTQKERNELDIAKVTFIRPKSNVQQVPDFAFDIVTIEREWTFCADSQDSMQLWLQLVSRCVDKDVAVVPDDMLHFPVKPKVDPSQTLNKLDYTTVLKVSAAGVSVTSHTSGDDTVERFFWCYTDFFKWSLLNQNGKMALLINVFQSEDFSSKLEFVFRLKEAVRLSTAIEYYIEKFMSVMHLKLEGEMESAPTPEPPPRDSPGGPEDPTRSAASPSTLEGRIGTGRSSILETGAMGMGGSGDGSSDGKDVDGWADGDSDEDGPADHELHRESSTGSVDLLDMGGLDVSDDQPQPQQQQQVADTGCDPFSASGAGAFPDDPFSSAPPSSSATGGDAFAADPFSNEPTPAPPNSSNAAAFAADPFAPSDNAGDPFGASPPAAPANGASDPFGSSDPFAAAPAPATAPVGPVGIDAGVQKQMPGWFQDLVVGASEGQLFSSAALNIHVKQEFRGSQARVTFTFSAVSAAVSGFRATLLNTDFLRMQVGDVSAADFAPGQPATLQVMLECMRPFTGSPSFNLAFSSGGQSFDYTVPVPIVVKQFLEPLALSSADFVQRWGSISGPGLEQQAVFKSAAPVDANAVKAKLASMNLQVIEGLDESTIVSAAGTMRTGAKDASDGKIAVGCLTRIELNTQANAFRATVRAVHGDVATEMKNLIEQSL